MVSGPIKRLGKILAFRGNIRILAIMAVLGGVQFSMLTAVWQPFVISLGASVAVLGFLQSLGGFYGVIPAIFGPIGGWISDRFGRKPIIIIGDVLRITALFIFVIAWVTSNWLLLIPGVVILGLRAIGFPAWDSTIAESAKIRRRGVAYATIGFFSILPAVLFPVIGGYIAGTLGFIVILFIAIILQSADLVLVYSQLKETLRRSVKKVTPAWGEFRKSLHEIFTPPANLRPFYLIVAADAISWGLGSSILYGMLVKSFNFTVLQIGVLVSILNFSKLVFTLPLGRLIDRYGSKAFMLTSQIVGIFVMTGWLLSTRFEFFAMLAILNGISITAWFPARKIFLAGSVASAGRGAAMGRIFTFQGMAAFPAPFIGGILYEYFGFWAPISGGLIGVLITAALIAFKLRELK